MPHVWKHPESKYWTACYVLPDGRRIKESCKLTSRSAALRVAGLLEAEAKAGLNERDARALIVRLHERCGMTEPRATVLASRLYERLGGRRLATSTVEDFFARWIERKRAETVAATARRYGEATQHFLAFLGPPAARRDLATLNSREIALFRDRLATKLSVSTVNFVVKVLRMVLEDGVKARLLTFNEAKSVPILKQSRDRPARRPFTEAELRAVLAAASVEWRAMILTSFYAGGQRLGDVARLTWLNVDLARAEIRFVTRKTRRTQITPIVAPLLTALSALPVTEKRGPVFPHAISLLQASKGEHVGALSNEFRDILVKAGLAEAQTHQRSGEGRSGRRKVSELGFHSLRHTFTSWAKSVGVNAVVVQDIVGHESTAISANYTHIDEDTKRAALEKLPDVSSPAPSGDAAAG